MFETFCKTQRAVSRYQAIAHDKTYICIEIHISKQKHNLQVMQLCALTSFKENACEFLAQNGGDDLTSSINTGNFWTKYAIRIREPVLLSLTYLERPFSLLVRLSIEISLSSVF